MLLLLFYCCPYLFFFFFKKKEVFSIFGNFSFPFFFLPFTLKNQNSQYHTLNLYLSLTRCHLPAASWLSPSKCIDPTTLPSFLSGSHSLKHLLSSLFELASIKAYLISHSSISSPFFSFLPPFSSSSSTTTSS